MKNNSVLFKVITFFYVFIIPLYNTSYIPKLRTVVLIPLIFIFFKNDFADFSALKNKAHRNLFFFFLSVLASIVVARDFALAVELVGDYVLFLTFYLIILKLTITEPASILKIIFAALLIGLIISLALGYLQFAGFKQFYIYKEDDLNENTVNEADDLAELVRAWGTFGNSLTYSNYLSVIGIMMTSYFIGRPQLKFKILTNVIFILTLIGLIFSAGRMASMIFVLGYLSSQFMQFRNLRSFYVFAFLAIFFIVLLNIDTILDLSLLRRFANSKDDFKEGRLDNWLYGFRILAESPLFGTGAGNLTTELYHLHHPLVTNAHVMSYTNGHLESVYMTILTTYGVIGFVFFMGLIIAHTKLILKLLKNNIKGGMGNEINALFWGWIVLLVNMLTNPGIIVDNRMTFYFLLLLILPMVIANYILRYGGGTPDPLQYSKYRLAKK